MPFVVMPDFISLPQHEVSRGIQMFCKEWIPAFAGMLSLSETATKCSL
jgi:hypothetical protein